MFSLSSVKSLAKASLFQNTPIYVQFYITARCNLTCQQCNIIYANSDVRECTIEEIEAIAENLAKIGVAMVLLTGGEPFLRKDLPQIIKAFEKRGVHVRMQTNGIATEKQIAEAVEAGGNDISISLDTLNPLLQDKINGGFPGTWERAIKAISIFTNFLPKKKSFASLGCVLCEENILDVEKVISFGSSIGWYTSLVPIHSTDYSKPMGFRTFDEKLKIKEEYFAKVDSLIERVRKMQSQGYLLYDSDQYLDDIKRFVRDIPTTWRQKNKGICDSPNLYFAILPNGTFAPCCDHRLLNNYEVYSQDFPKVFKQKVFKNEVNNIVKECEGCMYGSYPEMTVSMRYNKTKFKRAFTFFGKQHKKNWPIELSDIQELANNINSNKV